MLTLDQIWDKVEIVIDSIDTNDLLEPNIKSIGFYISIIVFLLTIRFFYGRNLTSVFVVLLIIVFRWKKKREDGCYVRGL